MAAKRLPFMKNQMNLLMVNMSGQIQGESNATQTYK